jgi:ferric-dicitrate binding protein FerR (iron transport regulator)
MQEQHEPPLDKPRPPHRRRIDVVAGAAGALALAWALGQALRVASLLV